MAFMVPVMHNDWDLYGTGVHGQRGAGSRRGSQQQPSSQPRSRYDSGCSSGFSRGPSFSSTRSAPTKSSAPRQQSRSMSGGSNLSAQGGQRSVTFGPPSPPPPSAPQTAPAQKSGFHAKVVDKLMKVIHHKEKGSRRS